MTFQHPPSSPAESTPRLRGAVRLAFAAVAALWVAQALLIGSAAGEPYPSVLMPAFPGSGGYADGHVRIERMEAVFVGPRGETKFSQRAFLSPLPDSHHGTVSGHLAPRRPGEERPMREALRRSLLPGLAAGRTDRRPGCPDPSLRAWARGRAQALLPGTPVQRLELRWSADTFRPGSRAPVRREPAGVFVIPLEEGAGCAR